MKRQRNTQQVKEHEKCPPSQTKEEKIGNLPEKEFRIIIIKMIHNLENKMELQVNSLETRIEKMQEMFNKDLEEIKESQLKMSNVINEIKNTLKGTNSRITEAEDKISEVEDKMVNLLMWCITLIDLQILKNPYILGIKPTWSWCIIFFNMLLDSFG